MHKQLDPRRAAHRVLVTIATSPTGSQEALGGVLGAAERADPRDRALATDLVYGTLRWRRRLDHALVSFAPRGLPVDNTPLIEALRLGAYQLLFLPRVPSWAAVDGSVRLVKGLRRGRFAAFVNGVLRALARRRDDPRDPGLPPLPAGDTPSALGVRYSLPSWLVARLAKGLGGEAPHARLSAENRPAPVVLRANTARIDVPALCERLREEGAGVRAWEGLPGAVRVRQPGRIFGGKALREGLWLPQDAASQRVVELLEPRPGERVLDLCCGAGVKTTRIAERVGPDGAIDASDLSPARIDDARRLFARWGLPWVAARVADGTELPAATEGYDRVLLDAPCSSLGVTRRRPEIRWRRREVEVWERAALQERLLDAAAAQVRPGGRLVYAVCTFTEEEGAGQIRRFLSRNREFRVVRPSDDTPAAAFVGADGLFRTDPTRDDQDAFFAAAMERRRL